MTETFKVAITFVSPSSEALAQSIIDSINKSADTTRAIKIQADMRDTDSPLRIIDATICAFGPNIDILVNNAGVESLVSLSELGLQDFNECIDVNFRAVVFMTKSVIPYLRSPGRIINISSSSAHAGGLSSGIYAASKAAVEALARFWATSLGPQGHSVNTVVPGLTQTDMYERIIAEESSAAYHRTVASMTPMGGRVGTPEDIARIVSLLVEPRSQWVTGQTISATGGLILL
ncbi:hypothetical protein COCC4DRAFT_155491 [Bipolaris maydis ATCC 48331]|uniref:Dehydrogenase OXI1 n=1 Tax=Cochliobolus heterostrophus (strain C4 / ATCC 48331 / race T) TaxID=665024 RepID=OXI1_COCH4|nr:uncharacterized protein COCC4DRAFT_155491 [Bipolaris maydis ATCC 48331]N4WE73.1 RecName: Full=Dehydrogenase OXI1; AltName: Full=T-toxin biosynthesis protein OXI1; Flags: Precursor [Bipolaris maydis ATCC 48331]ADB23430.1 putative short chain dehydrogenase [Bipolaris maydis]ENH98548.1 hypothetical protein COCC4DRAFT_155491 [Bipolaris maydis ATCC 48331]KAJ5028832.1 hypothetical protein J3E73DRAFT_34760 [Bipolaris maydis]KAJ5063623.1 putative short chain dehydrogenase [Bipolaris maydis]KAJ6199